MKTRQDIEISIENRIVLTKINSESPEQYRATLLNEKIGHLFLNNGTFEVRNTYNKCIYCANVKGISKFEEDEKEFYIRMAKQALSSNFYQELREVADKIFTKKQNGT